MLKFFLLFLLLLLLVLLFFPINSILKLLYTVIDFNI
ncbi:DUF2953 domain-containing protein, partial [Clostridium perfringens]|nr:DUF2953 domain-containing protein [Clostridium perfringens]